MTDIQKSRITVSLYTAGAIIISSIGLGFVISDKLNTLNTSVQSVRVELHEAIDSVKSRQVQRGYETDLKFQKIENKLDALGKK